MPVADSINLPAYLLARCVENTEVEITGGLLTFGV